MIIDAAPGLFGVIGEMDPDRRASTSFHDDLAADQCGLADRLGDGNHVLGPFTAGAMGSPFGDRIGEVDDAHPSAGYATLRKSVRHHARVISPQTIG
jgi:hypothetical protein